MSTTLSAQDCPTCSGLGTLGISPEGERIYCHDCVYGVEMHISAVSERMENAALWLRDIEHLREEMPDCFEVTETCLRVDAALFDELTARLDELKQDETNRPIAHLFEDV